MRLLELFAGSATVSKIAAARGWDVLAVDAAEECQNTDIVADLTTWTYDGPHVDLIWASPPCTEFSRESMPWCARGESPSLTLVHAAMRIVREVRPAWWVLENVRGAQRWIGRAPAHAGPFYLWGWYPPALLPRINGRYKQRLSGMTSDTQRARAQIPEDLAAAILSAVEKEAHARN